jgi:hypothetical protein
MDDKKLLDIALVTAIIGILILIIMSYYEFIPEKVFSDLTSKDVGQKVKMQGIIKSLKYYDSGTSIRLEQKCNIDIWIFSNITNLSKEKNAIFEGKIDEYNGKLELIADKVTIEK